MLPCSSFSILLSSSPTVLYCLTAFLFLLPVLFLFLPSQPPSSFFLSFVLGLFSFSFYVSLSVSSRVECNLHLSLHISINFPPLRVERYELKKTISPYRAAPKQKIKNTFPNFPSCLSVFSFPSTNQTDPGTHTLNVLPARSSLQARTFLQRGKWVRGKTNRKKSSQDAAPMKKHFRRFSEKG